MIARGRQLRLPAKHTLLLQGEVSRQGYYVESGCLRLWYNNDGEDISVKFFLPGDIVSSLSSFYLAQPSTFGLESVVPSDVRAVEKSDFDSELEDSLEFVKQMLKVAVLCMSDYQELFLNRIAQSPEDRYKSLLAQDPRLVDAVPQRYIASYLGVTPVSLSRIKQKLKRNGEV
ncbi:MAG: Crp/Fnr family transcriptional regulator [Pseudomonadota bacterium]